MYRYTLKAFFWSSLLALLVSCSNATASQETGLWTTRQELARIEMAGPAWESLLWGADQPQDNPNVAHQDDNTNTYVLASAIVWARRGEAIYREKVVHAVDALVKRGVPGGETLAWGRETGAYVLAADLVGYRTEAFEQWLRNMAEVWVGTDGRTLLQMYRERPNNWGMHAFGSLCAIYAYLGQGDRVKEIRDYWIQGVQGTNSGYRWGRDLSWHMDSGKTHLINPPGSVKQGMDIDGVIPDDQRRGGGFREPPPDTDYPWEALQGMVMAARILQRVGLPIWGVADRAIYRAAHCLQDRFSARYGSQWLAEGDDMWVLPFLDEAYGTHWASDQDRLWKHGKNSGWGYVVLAGK